MQNRDTISLRTESSENRIKSHIRERNHQWEIIEVSPAELPLGQDQHFRIRTLNGQALQLNKSDKLMVNDKEDQRGNHRVWLIKDLGNGSCTIFNEQSKKYLTTRDKGSYEWEPIVMSEAEFTAEDDKIWTIQPTSDFTYSIYTERDVVYQSRVRQQSLSLALDRGNVPILKAKKPAHNQIWLIEPEDAPITQPEDGTDPTKPEEVAPDLTPGDYKLKNVDVNEYYVKVVNRSGSYIFISSASTSANKFKVELKPGGVVLYPRLNSKDIYLATNSTGDSLVGQENLAYVWTVTKGDKSDQYFIINKDGKVLSSPSDRGSALTLESNAQSANQQWKFV